MHPTSTLCREQQARHEATAATTTLDNVRRRSTAAATAWRIEAGKADRREARQRGAPAWASATLSPPTDLSENPDRGIADR